MLSMDSRLLSANESALAAFSSAYSSAIASNLGISADRVKLSITYGSVNVLTTIVPAAGADVNVAAATVASLTNNLPTPGAVLPTSFKQQFGVAGMTVVQVSTAPPMPVAQAAAAPSPSQPLSTSLYSGTSSSSDSGLSRGAIVGIAVGAGVGGLLLLAVVVALIIKHKSRQRTRVKPDSPMPGV